ncbi:MAG: hypothetical protein GF331_24065, partial [Chitinivibrionales bacterium]|nr:hypothetical protein [Chitinivibrionales bacterium]
MKPRRWVLALAIVLFILGGAFTWGMRLLERRLGLEQVVVEQIEPLIGGTFDVGRVRFGFFSVYLHDVSASLPFDAFLIDVQDIKVGFSLRRLLTTKGDFGRSINTIILVHPKLTVNLSPTGEPMPLPDSSATQGVDIDDIDFPLQELRVRKGSVRVTGLSGEDLVFGEHLNGRIVEAARGIEFELYGRLASLRRNLALTGLIAGDDAPNRLSLRLDGARLTTPVRLPACTITRGRADGLCELTFGSQDSSVVEATGWIRIRDGAARFPSVRKPLTDLNLALTLEGTLWHLDSLSGELDGMRVHAAGTWDISRRQRSLLSVGAEAIDIERMFPDLPKNVSDNLYGQGRIAARLVAEPGDEPPVVTLSGGGFSVLGMPVTELAGRAIIEEEQVRLDSVQVSTMAAQLLVDGAVAVGDSFPAYRVSYRCAIDSLPTVAWLEGHMLVRGEATGRDMSPQVNLSVRLQNPSVFEVPLGTQTISVSGNARRLRAATTYTEGGISLSGLVESPFSPSPYVEGTLHVGAEPIRRFLTKVSPRSGSMEGVYSVTAEMSGTLPKLTSEAVLTMDSRRVEGKATLRAAIEPGEPRYVMWQLESEGLRVGQEAFPLTAAGRLYEDSMLVDTTHLLGGVKLAGSIGLTRPDKVDLTIDFDTVSLAAVNRWFFDGRLPLDSGALIGHLRVGGVRKDIVSSSELSVRDLAIGELHELETDAIVTTTGGTVQALPLVLRKDGRVVVALDTVVWGDRLRLKGEFDAIDIASFLGPSLLQDLDVRGAVSGTFTSSDTGLPVAVHVYSPRVEIEGFAIDSITLDGIVDSSGVMFERITAREGRRCHLSASAQVPWSFFGPEVGEHDTMQCALRITGDLLQSLEHNYCDVILGGSGEGTISASLLGTQQGWDFEALSVHIPTGQLTSKAYVPSGVSDFSLSMEMDDSMRVHTQINGYIGRRAVSIRSTHDIPSGYRPFEFGPIDFGILLAETPRQGVAIHLPGFHEPREIGEVEFQPLPPFPAFALSGPIDELRLTGVWVLRNCEFT